jgi:hypothetical protein
MGSSRDDALASGAVVFDRLAPSRATDPAPDTQLVATRDLLEVRAHIRITLYDTLNTCPQSRAGRYRMLVLQDQVAQLQRREVRRRVLSRDPCDERSPGCVSSRARAAPTLPRAYPQCGPARAASARCTCRAQPRWCLYSARRHVSMKAAGGTQTWGKYEPRTLILHSFHISRLLTVSAQVQSRLGVLCAMYLPPL